MNTLAYICGTYWEYAFPKEPGMLPNPAAEEQWLLWMIVSMTLLFAVVMRIARPTRRGCCLWCGYSLAGIGERAVCPECGKTR